MEREAMESNQDLAARMTGTIWLVGGRNAFETSAPGVPPFATREQIESCLRWADEYFVEPVCRVCHQPTSRRNERNLDVTVPNVADAAAFGVVGAFGGTRVEIFAEQFLDLLSDTERARLVLAPASMPPDDSRSFFELTGPNELPYAAIVGEPPRGWRCSSCSFRTWAYWRQDSPYHHFVCASDVPEGASVLVLGSVPGLSLGIVDWRFRMLKDRLEQLGVEASPVGVLAAEFSDRNPGLPTREEAERR